MYTKEQLIKIHGVIKGVCEYCKDGNCDMFPKVMPCHVCNCEAVKRITGDKGYIKFNEDKIQSNNQDSGSSRTV